MCRQKTVSTIEQDRPDSDFLDTLCHDNRSASTSEVNVNSKVISFKLDTGTEVTVISKETWKELGEPTLQPSDKHLFGPAQQSLSSWRKSFVTSCTRDSIFNTHSLW